MKITVKKNGCVKKKIRIAIRKNAIYINALGTFIGISLGGQNV